jgi:ATP-dependent RNA helicase DDX35
LKIIISSATVDAELFRDFFNFNQKKDGKDTAIILTVEGRMYSNEIFYREEPCPNYVQATVDTVMKIHLKEKSGDILAFLTGQEEVREAINLLKDLQDGRDADDLVILPFYGTLTNHDQLKVFFHTPKGKRKVIFATNIAETSVTIDGIVFVIDCGFVKVKWFSPESSLDSLIVLPISRAAAEQRAGRAGRIRPGKVYRLYTEEDFLTLPEHTPPEMRRTDLCDTILLLKCLGIDNILRFNFPSPPPAKNLLASIETLYALEALDDKGNLTKPLGYFLAEMPLSPMMSKMLYASAQLGCTEEILSIIAMLQVQSVFSKPTKGEGKIRARVAKRNFEVREGDLITLLNVYSAFVENGRTKEFCGQHCLVYRNLKRAHEIRGQLYSLVQKELKGHSIRSSNGNVEVIQKAILSGWFPFSAYLHHSGVYRTLRDDKEIAIHPMSALYTEKQPSWLCYCEILHTTQLFMKDITVIKADWLTEIAPNYYHKVTVKDD